MSRLGRALLLVAALACAAPVGAQDPTAAAQTFEIRGYQVDGNSLLDLARIASIVAPWTGPGRRIADVQAAATALQAAYADAGYAAVTVALPEQQVRAGTVRLVVTEPRLRAVEVVGNRHAGADRIRRSLPALQAGRTPHTGDLAREIHLANENPSRRLSVDLRSAAPGLVDAVVTVQDEKAWKVGAVLDDTGTPATGRTRIGAFVQHADVAGLDHVATLQYVTSPERVGDVAIVAFNHHVPLPALGDSLDLFAVYADVDSGVVGDFFQVRGRGTVLGLRYQRHLPAAVGVRHRLSFGFEQRKVDNRIGTLGSSPDLIPDVTLHPASLGYAATWHGDGRVVEASATAVRNIPGGNHGGAADIELARSGANPRYALLRYSASLQQALPAGGLLRLALDGQYSRDALVPAEQFGAGGRDSVRGFDEREVTNDRGNRLSLELQSADFGAGFAPGLAARALVFFDQAWLRRNRALPGETLREHLASAGVGLRLALAPTWSLRIDAARVSRGGSVRPRGDQRLHVSLGWAH